MAATKTAVTLIGLIACAALLSDNLVLMRNLMGGTADSALALVAPFLALAGAITVITAPLMASSLLILGFGFYLVGPFEWHDGMAGGANIDGLIALAALAIAAALASWLAWRDTDG